MGEDFTSYLIPTRSLHASGKSPLDRAIEVPARAVGVGHHQRGVVCVATDALPVLSRYVAAGDGFSPGGEVSFGSYGVTGLLSHPEQFVFVAPEKADFIHDDTDQIADITDDSTLPSVLPGLEPGPSSSLSSFVDGRVLASQFAADYSSTTLIELDAARGPALGIEIRGISFSIVRVCRARRRGWASATTPVPRRPGHDAQATTPVPRRPATTQPRLVHAPTERARSQTPASGAAHSR